MRYPLKTALVAALAAMAMTVGTSPTAAVGDAAAAAPIVQQAAADTPEPNEIVLENRKTGTGDWRIPWKGYKLAPDSDATIKAYASAVSVNKGESIDILAGAATTGPASWRLYRLGWYQGLGGREISRGSFTASNKQSCVTEKQPENTGLISCDWNTAFTVQTASDWTTGVYVVVLTRGTAQTYASFVVRDDDKKGAHVHLHSAMTNQAYNNFPGSTRAGKSLYPGSSYGENTVNGQKSAVKVSFDRPYFDSGAGYVMSYDAPLIRYTESRGFDMTYATDVDLHAHPDLLDGQTSAIAVGHHEYWSGEMFSAAEAARDAGVDVAFLGANNVYWQTRLEPSKITGTENRVVVVYRDVKFDPVKDAGATVLFRSPPVERPEQALIGQMWPATSSGMTYRDDPWTVQQADHWFYRGTGLRNGSQIPFLVGIEADRRITNYPEPTLLEGTTQAVLAHSTFLARDQTRNGTQNATLYQAPSGAYVFSAGTLRYTRGLLGDVAAQETVRTATTNLLARFQNMSLRAQSDRVGGADRYETAVKLSEYAFPGETPVGVPVAYLATGSNYPDALAASAATQGAGPVLLVPGPTIPQSVLDELERLHPAKLVVVGGEAIVSSDVAEQASVAAGVPAERAWGSDRYATAADLSARTFPSPDVPVAYVATGENFPDALAASAAAAQSGGPVLLTRGTTLSPSTRTELMRLKPQRIVIVGGTGVVTPATAGQLAPLAPLITRVDGPNRYETAMAVARDSGAPGTADTVALATGSDFPDALTAGPIVASLGGSLLLVGSSMSPAVAEELVRSDPRLVLLAGREGAVSEAVRAQVDALFAPPSTGTPPPALRRSAEPPVDPLDTWRTMPEPYDDQVLPWLELPPEQWQPDPGLG